MNIGCLDDIVQAVSSSATPNVAQLVGSQSDEMIVPTYNWSNYFDEHSVKTAQEDATLLFFSRFPGQVKVYNELHGNDTLHKEPSWTPMPTELPKCILATGLSLECQWYLDDKIQEFCPYNGKDLVCSRSTQPLN